jgi:hypothetical protein
MHWKTKWNIVLYLAFLYIIGGCILPSTHIEYSKDVEDTDPSPRIRWLAASAGLEDASGLRSYWIRVENWHDFPIGRFVEPSSTYRCPGSSYTGRIIVQVRSSVEEYPLALYCDLLHPSQLSQLAFDLPKGLEPEVFLLMWDTNTGENWMSNRIKLPKKAP